MRKVINHSFLLSIIILSCTPKAFKKQNAKLNFLLDSNSKGSVSSQFPLDTIRIFSKDSFLGRYNFLIGYRFWGAGVYVKENGTFKDYQWTDVGPANYILRLRSRHGKWQQQKNGTISFRYCFSLKKYNYLCYRYHKDIFLVQNGGVEIFCNRINQIKDSLGNLNHIRLMDSTALLKYR